MIRVQCVRAGSDFHLSHRMRFHMTPDTLPPPQIRAPALQISGDCRNRPFVGPHMANIATRARSVW